MVKKIVPSLYGEISIVLPSDHDEYNRYLSNGGGLLSGKEITMRHDRPYMTSDKLELEFFSTITGVQICEVDELTSLRYDKDKEVKPDIYNQELTIDQALKFVFKDGREDKIIEHLKANGYKVDKAEIAINGNTSVKQVTMKIGDMVSHLKANGYIVYKKKG